MTPDFEAQDFGGGAPLPHAEMQELLGVYALDACEPDVAAMVEAHIETCLRCAVEVGQHHEVAGLLANSGGASPARLWDGIAERLGGTSEQSWDRLAARLEASEPSPEALPVETEEVDGPVSPSAPIVPLPMDRRRRWATAGASMVAAAAVVVAVSFGVETHDLQGKVAALEAAPPLSAMAQAAATQAGAERFSLASTTASGDITTPATVALTASGTGFVMNDAGDGLPALPKDRTYQLWGEVGGRTVSLGLLGPDPTIVPFSVAGSATPVAYAITDEVSGGVVHSVHAPVAMAAVRKI